MQKKVIICDQQKLYAMGCHSLLKNKSLFDEYCQIETLDQVNDKLLGNHSKLLIIDSGLLAFNEPRAAYKINELNKLIPIMVLINEDDDLQLYQIIDSGVSVVVSRNVSQEEYIKAIEMACEGKIYFCSTISHRVFDLVNKMDKIKMIERVNKLASYDKYILVRICDEASSKQIAAEVGHSKRTIEGHRTKLMQLLEVKNLAGLVKVALNTKLYDDYLTNPGLYDINLCAKTSAL
jgi:DNA-binding NarL/FixJ family response regulator